MEKKLEAISEQLLESVVGSGKRRRRRRNRCRPRRRRRCCCNRRPPVNTSCGVSVS